MKKDKSSQTVLFRFENFLACCFVLNDSGDQLYRIAFQFSQVALCTIFRFLTHSIKISICATYQQEFFYNLFNSFLVFKHNCGMVLSYD